MKMLFQTLYYAVDHPLKLLHNSCLTEVLVFYHDAVLQKCPLGIQNLFLPIFHMSLSHGMTSYKLETEFFSLHFSVVNQSMNANHFSKILGILYRGVKMWFLCLNILQV